MKLLRYQISFFTPEAAYGNVKGIITKFSEQVKDVLNGEMTILPIPQNAPIEFPRALLKSKDNHIEFFLKLDRIDIIYNRPYENSISDSELENFKKNVILWINHFYSEYNIGINRIGIIWLRVIPETLNKANGEFLANKFCKDEFQIQPFGNAKKFELHCMKNFNFKNKDVNSWVRIQTLTLNPSNKEIVGITNDLNNIPTTNFFNKDELKEFVMDADGEIKKIIKYYGFQENENE